MSLDLTEDFVRVIARVSKIMYTQQYEGAAAGLINSNLAARYLSLSDKSEVKQTNINSQDYVNYTELSDETLKEITHASKRLES